MGFLEDVNDFLQERKEQNKDKNITVKERNKVIEAIKYYYKYTNFTMEGPCFDCKKHIKYNVHQTHYSRGDDWYFKLLNDWTNGKSIKTSIIFNYLCDDCVDLHTKKIKKIEKEKKEALRKERIFQREQQVQYLNNIVYNDYLNVSMNEAYKSLCEFMSYYPEKSENLKAMDYKSFLDTSYWKIIRRYVLKRDNFRCSLCSSKNDLRVHHKTYENHGHEHDNLNDLIVLCENCHHKFHGIEEKNNE